MNIGFIGSKFGFTPQQIKAIRHEIYERLPVENVYGGYSYISDFQLREIIKESFPKISFIEDKESVLKQRTIFTNPQKSRCKTDDIELRQSLLACRKDDNKSIVEIGSDGMSEEYNGSSDLRNNRR